MKDFNPESFLISSTAAKTVSRLSETECKQWLVQVVANFEGFIRDEDFQPKFEDSIVGDMVAQTWNSQRAGLVARKKKHFANPSGENKGTPIGEPIDSPNGEVERPPPIIHSVIHTDSCCSRNERGVNPSLVQRTASAFKDADFQYEGSGTLEGFIGMLFKQGFAERDLLTALTRYTAEVKKRPNKRDHCAYYLTVLGSVTEPHAEP